MSQRMSQGLALADGFTGVDDHFWGGLADGLSRRAEQEGGRGSLAQGSMSFSQRRRSSSVASSCSLNSFSILLRASSSWLSRSSVEVGKMRFSSWILVFLSVPLLNSSVYSSLLMQFTGHFSRRQVVLHSRGGQQLPAGMSGMVPPNFCSICEGWAYSKSGCGTFSSKRLIFSTVSGSRKRLTMPQMMEMEVVMRTLQPANRRERQVSERKPKAFCMVSFIWKRPWQPESTSATQFSTCPGMKQWRITYSKKQICVSCSSSSLIRSRTRRSASNTSSGRQWQSRPITQNTPSPSSRATSRPRCSSFTRAAYPSNRSMSATHLSSSHPVDSRYRSRQGLSHRSSSRTPLASRCCSSRSSCSTSQAVQVSSAHPSNSSRRIRFPSPILKSSRTLADPEWNGRNRKASAGKCTKSDTPFCCLYIRLYARTPLTEYHSSLQSFSLRKSHPNLPLRSFGHAGEPPHQHSQQTVVHPH